MILPGKFGDVAMGGGEGGAEYELKVPQDVLDFYGYPSPWAIFAILSASVPQLR